MESGRSQRKKADKLGRNAALERLKHLKERGTKNKYEVSNIDNVYDTIDEREYSKKVLERQDDDWIVDDGGEGYIEDGREIFDDDLDDESLEIIQKSKHGNKSLQNKKKNQKVSKGSLQHMIANMSSKKKDEVLKTDDDNILSDLISNLDSELEQSVVMKRKATKQDTHLAEQNAVKEYLRSLRETTSELKNKYNNADETVDKVETEVSLQESSPKSKNTDIEVEKSQLSQKCKQEDMEDDLCSLNNMEDFLNDDSFNFDMATDENISNIEIKDQIEDPVHCDKKNEIHNWISKDWDNFDQNNILQDEKVKSEINTSNIIDNILKNNESDQKTMNMFWWDICEDPFKPGVVYVFGKTYVDQLKKYVSCCLTVKNIERRVFILPRQFHYDPKTNKLDENNPVSMINVYNEINSAYAKEVKIRSRTVTKKFCFDGSNIPQEAEYLEVRYPPNAGKLLSPKCPEARTFEHVFGTNTNFLEIFLLDRKMKGPCWLEIQNFNIEENPVSWCNLEVYCDNINYIQVAEKQNDPPPLVITTINICSIPNINSMENEIVMIGCMSHSSFSINKPPPNPPYEFHFCAISRPSGEPWPLDLNETLKQYKKTKVQKCDSERELINYWLTCFSRIDPDIIIGHDLIGYQLDIMVHRMKTLKINGWSRLGKLRRSKIPDRIRNIQLDALPGRPVCDLKILAKELIKSRSFELGPLCTSILNIKEEERFDIQQEDIKSMFQSVKELLQLIFYTMQDTTYIIKMICKLNALPLALQITNITGFVLSKTLSGGRSERNEYLLLHAFTKKNYIVPDKELKFKDQNMASSGETSKRKKAAYAGGLVLEPVVGFHDKLILLMDFNSLYPSIIQEYNVCFTTIDQIDEDSCKSTEPGILPTEIQKLVESRKQVKNMMRNQNIDTDKYAEYNIRQMALKLTANSMYGCLGFSGSRFYAEKLAAFITKKGREILMNTKELVQKMNYEVIYGDTDSLMIKTDVDDYNEVMKKGVTIKRAINKIYKHVELDIDGVFRYLLLLKKKKYAAITITKNKKGELVTEREIKGLDIVRRDWSRLAAEAGKVVLDYILSDVNEDDRISLIHEHLLKLKQDLEGGKIPISLLIITKQLTKDPSTYADKKSLPHVQVAIRYNLKGGKRLRRGDIVPYVIMNDGSDLPAIQRAYHVEELKNNQTIKIDTNYYLSQQIFPVVSRICEPINGVELYKIAEILGMDGSNLKQKSTALSNNQNKEQFITSCKNVDGDSFNFECISCGMLNSINGPLIVNESEEVVYSLDVCSNKECKKQPIDSINYLQNKLTLSIRMYINKYYNAKLICEDSTCNYEHRNVSKNVFDKQPICHCGGFLFREYTAKDLYKQLECFVQIFNLNALKNKPVISSNTEKGFRLLHMIAEENLMNSRFSRINLSLLFGFLNIQNAPARKEDTKVTNCETTTHTPATPNIIEKSNVEE